MSWHAEHHRSVEEYLALERRSELRHEYLDGAIYAMVGASPAHNLIVTNVVGELRQQLKRRPCRVYATDQRVRVRSTGLYTYPDLVVSCGGERFDERDQRTLLNPLLIVEVLSRSTESYDRGAKFEHYRRIPELQEYLLIDQEKPHLEHFQRQPDGRWLLSEASGLEAVLELPVLEGRLALTEVYDKVVLRDTGPGHPPPDDKPQLP